MCRDFPSWQQVATVACDGAQIFVAEPNGLWRLVDLVGFAADETAGETAGDHLEITQNHPKSPDDQPVIAGDPPVIAQPARYKNAHSAAQARYRAKCKAQGRPYGSLRCAKTGDTAPDRRVIAGDFAAAALKKEEEVDPSSFERRARDAPDAYKRKESKLTGILRRAQAAGLLSRDTAGRLWGELMLMRPDPTLANWGLPRRANDELDELDRRLRAFAPSQGRLPLGGSPILATERGPPRAAPARTERSPGRIIDGRWWPDHASGEKWRETG